MKIFLVLGLFASCLSNDLWAQSSMKPTNQSATQTSQKLSASQQAIVTVSAFMAQGNIPQLTKALNTGLDAGLTISEIKEILVQLYAYAGFPRSLNALQAFSDVLKERKQRGINDPVGKEPSLLPADTNRRQFGTDNQTKLIGMPIKGGLFEFAPAIDQFLKEHLFGDIFGRDNLDWKTRELATISALASLGGVDSQLRSHLNIGMHNGLTEGELTHLVAIIQTSVGEKEGAAASQVWQALRKERAGNPSTK
ncbi:carboxymuconolactone decarboxylase family protein [Spirosoma fluviale]|uniref:Uncharacterized conserved protein YurZ, alkylhydroperoxidase/carboxymuconolactone decarboxylase family n=1 Tax=Spirosoma fluviale TaxID=1597977 RepID=A0A286FA38_9BACT|nr:carboxymuconolactone decarboxylase family protein [Spirosoma fluviale]SOD80072.1 Uncharacterized conserved protein YurZ, alkylhydroperoxidase/carboxymuconolactone decarboxylase family [Spirosoma fluviale]